jgi:hypothetical protein
VTTFSQADAAAYDAVRQEAAQLQTKKDALAPEALWDRHQVDVEIGLLTSRMARIAPPQIELLA